jgi:hypothetical protein
MRRAAFIVFWTMTFDILTYLLMVIPFAFFLLHRDSDPPTEYLFVAVMILCPSAGLLGFILGLLRKLPGTK